MLIQQGSRVLFFGDSITAYGDRGGYVDLIRGYMAANHSAWDVTLLSSGVSGNNVEHLRKRFDRDVKPKKPTIVVIFVGVNDVGKVRTGPEVPLPTFTASLAELITRTRAINAVPLLVSLAVYGEKKDGGNPLDARCDAYLAATLDVATANSCEVIDARTAFMDFIDEHNHFNLDKGILTSDQVHPNPLGHSLLGKLMIDVLAGA